MFKLTNTLSFTILLVAFLGCFGTSDSSGNVLSEKNARRLLYRLGNTPQCGDCMKYKCHNKQCGCVYNVNYCFHVESMLKKLKGYSSDSGDESSDDSNTDNHCAKNNKVSLPQFADDETLRQNTLSHIRTQVWNEQRYQMVAGERIKLNHGATIHQSNFTRKIFGEDLELFNLRINPDLQTMFIIANGAVPTTKLSDYTTIYGSLVHVDIAEWPVTSIDDKQFAEERLTIRGYRLRIFDAAKDTLAPHVNNAAPALCGATVHNLQSANRLFVEDLSFASQYNDASTPYKYTPSVKGYFCVRNDNSFNVLAIHLMDTDLTYTMYDDKNEWILAKMALNTASVIEQEVGHFVPHHLILEPMRTEMYRWLSSNHPVYRLLDHHFEQLWGASVLGFRGLFSKGTVWDLTSGWGAIGSAKYYSDGLRVHSFTEDAYPKRLVRDGLNHIPVFKQRDDILSRRAVLETFLDEFLRVYYTSDAELMNDYEITKWLSETSKFVIDFPASVSTVTQLKDILLNVVSRIFEHDARNGQITWHTASFPYSLPGLFHPLPTQKGVGDSIDLKNYLMPDSLLGASYSLIRQFTRGLGTQNSMAKSYSKIDLGAGAKAAINKFENDMSAVDTGITLRELSSPKPFIFLKSSRTYHYANV